MVINQTLSNAPSEVSDLFYAVSIRSPDKVIEALHAIQLKSLTQHLTDEHLEIVARALRPTPTYGAMEQLEGHRRYRSRMIFLRRWMRANHRAPTQRLWALFLEEARIDKMHRKSSTLADLFWRQMQRSDVKPDVYCYNSYIAATCIQPSIYDELPMRRKNETERSRAYRQKSEKRAEAKAHKAVLLYRDLLKQELEPTAMTIELLMLALGASKRLDAISSLLLQQWNISVPGSAKTLHEGEDGVVDEYEEEGISFDRDPDPNANTPVVSPSSPLFPSQATLTAIAKAYGLNNRINMGFSIISQMARVYNINIEPKTWTELMHWSYKDAAQHRGFTPDAYMLELFRVARDEWSIRPSVGMYHILLTHLVKRQWDSDRIFPLFDAMLSSIDQQAFSMHRPWSQIHHARAVSQRIVAALVRAKTDDIGKLQRRMVTQRDGAATRLQRTRDDIDRRKKHLQETTKKWEDRIALFETRIAALTAAERERLTELSKPGDGTSNHDETEQRELEDEEDFQAAIKHI